MRPQRRKIIASRYWERPQKMNCYIINFFHGIILAHPVLRRQWNYLKDKHIREQWHLFMIQDKWRILVVAKGKWVLTTVWHKWLDKLRYTYFDHVTSIFSQSIHIKWGNKVQRQKTNSLYHTFNQETAFLSDWIFEFWRNCWGNDF